MLNWLKENDENMEEPDSDEIIKDIEIDKLRDKDIIIAMKVCNHCNQRFNLTNEDVWKDDGWIKDAKCPFCRNIVHVWIKIL